MPPATPVRTIAVVTTSRADYSYYRPILRRIVAAPDLRLRLYVTGMHLCPSFGMTVKAIEEDGFEIAERVDMLLAADTPAAIATSMGIGMIGIAAALARTPPDILLLLGDRFEMLAAASAALPFAIPIAHIAGGELSEGAIDDAARHAITKMSHIHFAQTPVYADRIMQMGEEPWRVTVTGAASLDNLRQLVPLSREQLEERFGLTLEIPPLLVTFHPATLEYGETDAHTAELMAALDASGMPVIFTAPNGDTNHALINRAFARFIDTHADARVVTSLGTEAYFSLLRFARALVGNSSSGIIEAASFELPVVNVGDRQAGRIHGPNVVDVPCERSAIADAIARVTSDRFRERLRGVPNPYGEGNASDRIVEVLQSVPLGLPLVMKRFNDGVRLTAVS